MNVTGQFPGLRRLEGDRWGRVWYTEESGHDAWRQRAHGLGQRAHGPGHRGKDGQGTAYHSSFNRNAIYSGSVRSCSVRPTL